MPQPPPVENKATEATEAKQISPDPVLTLLESILKEQNGLRGAVQLLDEGLTSRLDRIEKSALNERIQLPSMLQRTQTQLVPEEQDDEFNPVEEEARKWFQRIDKANVGILSSNDFKPLLVNFSLSSKQTFRNVLDIKREEDLDRLIAAADADGDGEISEEEFVQLVRLRTAELKENGPLLSDAAGAPNEVPVFGQPSHEKTSRVGIIVRSIYFEFAMAFVIVANMGVMCLRLQLDGLAMGSKLRLTTEDHAYPSKFIFEFLEQLFIVIYVAELILRLWVQRMRFFWVVSDVADAALVILSCVDVFLLQYLEIKFVSLSVLRIARLARFGRFFKILRFSEHCSEVRVLIHTLYSAIRGAIWSGALLGCIITAGGIFMTQLAHAFMNDTRMEPQRREWLYSNFGTVTSSMYAMFESTFPGTWPAFSRPLIEEVHYAFSVFWVLWVVLVSFVTIRVVGAVFLAQTMQVAIADQEKCAMHQLKKKGEMSETLRMMFRAADTSGDGAMSQEEFDQMISQESVVDDFAKMGMDVDAVSQFFAVLIADDGTADYEEFITGALAMATSAPGMDMMKNLQEQIKLTHEIQQIKEAVLAVKHMLSPKPRRSPKSM